MARHELFREHLAALELCCGARRTEDRPASLDEQIDDAAIERKLGPDDRQVDALAFSEVEHCPRIRRSRRRSCVATSRMPDVAGCAKHGVDSRFGGELPGERVLAATGADDHQPHTIYGEL